MKWVTVFALLCGCAGEIDDPARYYAAEPDASDETPILGPVECDVTRDVFVPSCGSCHDSETRSADLDLVSPGIETRLLVDSTSLCGARPLVVPGDPESSLLYLKLFGASGCGARMPLFRAALSDEDIACVGSFIADMAGAP